MPKSKLRVVHTIPSVQEKAAGPSYSVVRLCEMQSQSGVDVKLLSVGDALREKSKKFYSVFSPTFGPQRLGCSSTLKAWLVEGACRNDFDLIHNHSLWMMPNVYPGIASKKSGVPLVTAPRGTLSKHAMQSGSVIKKLFWPLVQKPAIEATSCFHATAMSEYHDIRRLGFLQPIAIIPNGIDMPVLVPKTLNSIRSVLFLGRIHPIKGLDMLLPAWKTLQNKFPDWQLKIVGPDHRGYLSKVKGMSEALGLKRVEFCKPLFGGAKTKALIDADLFVLPSYSENFGMSVAEALAAGTPALVTKGAPWSGLQKNRAGFWVDTNLASITSAMEEAMLKDDVELRALGRNGRAWMKNEYSWKKINLQMLTTYEWVVNGGKTPPWVIEN